MSTVQKWMIALLAIIMLAILGMLVLLVGLSLRPALFNEQSPMVVIGAPASGTTIDMGQDVNVLVEARDAQGVMRVDLWVDGKALASQVSQEPHGQAILTMNHAWRP
jgi:hypothetical protein